MEMAGWPGSAAFWAFSSASSRAILLVLYIYYYLVLLTWYCSSRSSNNGIICGWNKAMEEAHDSDTHALHTAPTRIEALSGGRTPVNKKRWSEHAD